jgi:hypothetical protein
MAIEFLLGEHVAASLLRSSSAFAAYPGRAGPRRIADSGRKHTQENDTMALGSDQIGCVEKSGECAGMQDEVKVVDAKMRWEFARGAAAITASWNMEGILRQTLPCCVVPNAA